MECSQLKKHISPKIDRDYNSKNNFHFIICCDNSYWQLKSSQNWKGTRMHAFGIAFECNAMRSKLNLLGQSDKRRQNINEESTRTVPWRISQYAADDWHKIYFDDHVSGREHTYNELFCAYRRRLRFSLDFTLTSENGVPSKVCVVSRIKETRPHQVGSEKFSNGLDWTIDWLTIIINIRIVMFRAWVRFAFAALWV